VNVLASLTANQVRLHHAIYSALAEHERPPAHNLADAERAHQVSVRAPVSAAAALLSYDDETKPADSLGEALLGLRREGLLGEHVSLRSTRGLRVGDVQRTSPSSRSCRAP
jgi:hypothetical protein